jgi:phospholipase C
LTIEVSRRQLMASMGGMVLASYALPSALRKALDNAPPSVLSSATKVAPVSEIKHVVVLMQENRSFDHYFGAMPGVRGFADPSVSRMSFTRRTRPTPRATCSRSTRTPRQATRSRSRRVATAGARCTTAGNNGGKMDGFVTAHIAADGEAGQYTMAYFKRDDIPFQWALADAFTVCDGYHCSMLGPTWPNRLYLMTGQVDPSGAHGGPVYSNEVPAAGFSWTTYPELLTQAGVSWKVYQENDNYGMNVLEYFDQYQNASTSSPLYQNAMRFYQPGSSSTTRSTTSCRRCRIIPTSYQSEHPDYMPAAGADYVASKVNAIAANPDVWAKTVFILIYDENDGFFDHVNPPTAPTGTAGEYITVDKVSAPIGLGFRVPCVIVSPWTVGGYVCHDTFDHTSVTRLLELVTGVTNPNISAWRRKTVGDFTSALGTTPNGRFPRLPATTAQLELAEKRTTEFGLPPIPGASQSFPVQGGGSKPVRSTKLTAATSGSVTV